MYHVPYSQHPGHVWDTVCLIHWLVNQWTLEYLMPLENISHV